MCAKILPMSRRMSKPCTHAVPVQCSSRRLGASSGSDEANQPGAAGAAPDDYHTKMRLAGLLRGGETGREGSILPSIDGKGEGGEALPEDLTQQQHDCPMKRQRKPGPRCNASSPQENPIFLDEIYEFVELHFSTRGKWNAGDPCLLYPVLVPGIPQAIVGAL